jgi:tetratricopeptide (TPR) repeat protein
VRTSRLEAARLAAWVVLLLAGLFFLTTGGTYPGIASVEGHVIGQFIAIVVLGGWLAIALVRPAWRPRAPLLLPLAIASAAYLASALVSQRPRLSLEPTIAGLGWALALLFLSRLVSVPWFRARVAVVMTAFVAIVSIGYLVQVGGEWVTWWGLVGRLALPPLRPSFAALFLGSPNLIATALMLLTPLVVVLLLRRGVGWVGVGLAVAAALATFVSGSRGAYAGVGIGLMVAVALFVARRRTTFGARPVTAMLRQRPILIIPALAVVATGVAFAPAVLRRFEQGGADLRLDLWRSALTIFAAHPVLGAGPGTWVQLKVAANPPGVPNLILPHAHDMYVQAAAELGIVGLIALALLALAVLRRLWAGWRSDRWLEAGAVIVSLAAFAGQSIVDNFSNLPFVCLLVATLVAWVDGGLALDAGEGATSEEQPVGRPRRSAWRSAWRSALVPVAGLVAMALVMPTLLRIDRAATLDQQGNDAALHGHWQLALDAFDEARTTDPGFTLYEIQTASALARVGRTAEARDLLAHAVETDPVAVNVIGLAALEAQLGDREAALGHVREAVALGVGEPVVALNAGIIAERLGEPALALDQFANALAWDPPLASANVWTTPPRGIAKRDVVSLARARTNALDAALILAYSGDAAAARAELEAIPVSAGRDAYLAMVIGLEGDLPLAFHSFDTLLDRNPSDWFAAALASRLAHRAAAADQAAGYLAWATAVQGDAAPAVAAEASVVPAAMGWDAGLPGAYPWAVYLRPTVPYLLASPLTLIGGL